MKKILSAMLLVVGILILPATTKIVNATTVTQGEYGNKSNSVYPPSNEKEKVDKDFTYCVTPKNEIAICEYTGSSKSVVIPEKIDNKPVTILNSYFVFHRPNITSISIPKTVRYINSVFSDRTQLKTITVASDNPYFSSKSGVLYDKAQKSLLFYPRKRSSTTYTVPSTVTEIRDQAFYGSNMIKITIPDSVKKIGASAFNGCSKLQSVRLSHKISKIPNMLFAGCTKLSSISIPSSVTCIGWQAFVKCKSLTKVTIPKNVKDIDAEAFSGCKKLKTVQILGKPTAINSYCFSKCINLTSINLPSSLKKIDYDAFKECKKLKSISIPSTVSVIRHNAFEKCSLLAKISVSSKNKYFSSSNGVLFNKNKTILYIYPSGKTTKSYSILSSVKKLDMNAFRDCNYLTSLTIGKNVSSIYNIYGCKKLSKIAVNTSNNYFSSKNGILYNKNKTELVAYPAGRKASKYTLPSTVKKIRSYAFSKCVYLQDVVVPGSVIKLNSNIFFYCKKLRNITLKEGLTNLTQKVFHECRTIKKICIPKSVKNISSIAIYCCGSVTIYTPKNSYTYKLYKKEGKPVKVLS